MRNLVFFAGYLLPAVALGYYLPQWLPLLDRGVAIGVGVVVLLGGGLLHEARARLRADALRGEQLIDLRQALFHLQDELSWSRREIRTLGEAIETVARSGRAGRSGQGGRAIEEVMAEVKALKALVQQRPVAVAEGAPELLAADGAGPAVAAVDPAPQPPPPGKAPRRLKAETPPPPEQPPEQDATPPAEQRAKNPVKKIVKKPAQKTAQKKARKTAPTTKRSSNALVLAPLPRALDETSVLDTVRRALRDDRVDLALQPIVALPQRKRCHVECFSRVMGPDGTVVLPERYIAVAERAGLITAIDNMLLLRCIQLVRQVQRRGDRTGFFCNISPHTLEDEDFFGDFVDFLDTNHDLAPNLIFEFTQASLARHGPAETRHLDRLAMLGCRFSIDRVEDLDLDVTALNRRRVAFVKVAAAKLLAEAARDAMAPHRLKRALAREGIDLVIEKLEDEATLRELLDYGINFGQGFLFGEPRAVEAA